MGDRPISQSAPMGAAKWAVPVFTIYLVHPAKTEKLETILAFLKDLKKIERESGLRLPIGDPDPESTRVSNQRSSIDSELGPPIGDHDHSTGVASDLYGPWRPRIDGGLQVGAVPPPGLPVPIEVAGDPGGVVVVPDWRPRPRIDRGPSSHNPRSIQDRGRQLAIPTLPPRLSGSSVGTSKPDGG
ncbi:hypothetical protein CRG98_030446 [Punica granatum]|uniref:Uncharacterized protein n=1 Tax=Punica granatum TaxID=22663 RepID=A0A2I0IYT7_PUNGR|nr:hypothetical protein CRG98_030446 [Punica granatum]